ncbi:polysaccharide pyruvyl transferase family protein [Colwellia psychrerythraea]|uniref:Polysaccharide pyruvyl transferase n=1 Tax=Colwellia psychrerythraea TaxID=28229 RepID=A0A099K9D8_COLPS|nr:polysaccharide pyruvyl transferase family protein [Colwellia psychrerythraea]KGJ86657.1 polysaccharide pyruvyl transferase [Colwellia psychrerythraea]
MFKKYDAYLVGYYGMRNSGDDALMYATAWAAKNILGCSNTKVGLYGDYTRETQSDNQLPLKFTQQFPGQNRLLHYKTAIQSKRIIFGGGSVLHSEHDINLKRQLMSLANQKKSLAVGIGIGPFNSVMAEKSCAKFLDECGYVGVRDHASLAIAQSIAPNANVHKTFDLAPLLLCSKQYKAPTKERKGIALTLCSVAIDAMGNTDQFEEEKRVEQFVQLITKLYAKTGEPITLIEFNGHKKLGDWQINNTIITRLLDKYIPVCIKKYEPNPIILLNQLSGYKAIVSMRLHGAILGYLANTPVLSINYHSKCNGWCDEVGMPENYRIDLLNLNIEKIVSQITLGISTTFQQPSLPINKALKNSLSNWSIQNEQLKFYRNYSTI